MIRFLVMIITLFLAAPCLAQPRTAHIVGGVRGPLDQPLPANTKATFQLNVPITVQDEDGDSWIVSSWMHGRP